MFPPNSPELQGMKVYLKAGIGVSALNIGSVPGRKLRLIVFIVVATYTAALIWLTISMSKDLFSSSPTIARSIAVQVLEIAILPYIICIVPAFLLALGNSRLPLAFALCIIAIPLFFATGFLIA
jgi:hypothetical protein